MRVAGIDGCRAGWLAFMMCDDKCSYLLSYDLAKLIPELNAELIFIDIPIGLTSVGYTRNVDRLARTELKPYKTSSIFTPPCRDALHVKTYAEALELNRRVAGKGISLQSWNISAKIREADLLLRDQPNLKPSLFEAHPEICFKYLNGGAILATSKKTSEGFNERSEVLSTHNPGLLHLIEQIMGETLRKDVAKDDILDAAVLALSASYAAHHGINLVGNHAETDAMDIPVRIAFGKE